MNWSQQALGAMINSSIAQHLYTSIWRDNTATDDDHLLPRTLICLPLASYHT